MKTTESSSRDRENIDNFEPETTALGRRKFLAQAAALGATALIPWRSLDAQRAPKNGWIDVHHHFGPPTWIDLMTSRKILQSSWKGWTPAKAIEDMDKGGVTTALVSITTPGIWLGDFDLSVEGVRKLARECNEYGATMASDYPGRFGLFSVLPLPYDIEGSLREIEYTFDTLKADGVGILTSYGDKWLGDPFYAPVFEELNRRKAVVYTHPTTAACCRNLIPNTGFAYSALEYNTDTTRTILSLVTSGAAARYTDISFIFSHAGGTMPYLIQRMFGRDVANNLDAPAKPGSPLDLMRRFYYDTAQQDDPVVMAMLKKVVGISQIVFGTDYPYSVTEEDVKDLKQCGVFNAQELEAMGRENALKFLPKYRA